MASVASAHLQHLHQASSGRAALFGSASGDDSIIDSHTLLCRILLAAPVGEKGGVGAGAAASPAPDTTAHDDVGLTAGAPLQPHTENDEEPSEDDVLAGSDSSDGPAAGG